MSKALRSPRGLKVAAAGASTSPDPEVPDKPVRRRFTTEYKRRILAEADAARTPGEVGALLRREGLYSSLLSEWRAARRRGELAALVPKRRGPKAVPKDPRDTELARLERENELLQKKLRKAELMIDLQKKVSQILGVALPAIENDEDDARTR